MTLARRGAALGNSLTPAQLVLRWLAEAHMLGSLEGYGRALLDGEQGDRARHNRRAASVEIDLPTMRGDRGGEPPYPNIYSSTKRANWHCPCV